MHLDKARDLKIGEFLQQYGSKIAVEEVPLFRSPAKPQLYMEPKKPTLMQRMMKAVIGDAGRAR